MVMPAASTSSRICVTGGPMLLTPSPDTSMTWRMAAIARRVEQRLGELQRAVDRGARCAPIGRARDLARDRVGELRAVDQPPRHQDGLVVQAGPFEIGDRDLAVRAGAQRGEEFARGQRRPHSLRAAAPALPGPSSSRRRRRSPARRRPASRWGACRRSEAPGRPPAGPGGEQQRACRCDSAERDQTRPNAHGLSSSSRAHGGADGRR